MVKCLPEFEYFSVFLKNKNIIFKIRRSTVTDYAALTLVFEYSTKINVTGEKCTLAFDMSTELFPINLTTSTNPYNGHSCNSSISFQGI